MTGFVLAGSAPYSLLSHLALYGLAAICADAGHRGLALSWTAGVNSRPRLDGESITEQTVAAAVHSHAAQRSAEGSWLYEDFNAGKQAVALMSPRIAQLDPASWPTLQQRRHGVLDRLTEHRAELDLRLLAALGEPCYWRRERDKYQQDDAANLLEMKPRNWGSEFVGTRLRKVAEAVAARTPEQVADGLAGRSVVDEVGKNSPDSRSATGLDGPGPADNALVWCALWAISQFPLGLRVGSAAVTTGHVGHRHRGAFYVPLWLGPWTPARLRTVVASHALRVVAAATHADDRDGAEVAAAREWLAARAVTAVVTFPVRVFGSANAPERRAARGRVRPLAAVP